MHGASCGHKAIVLLKPCKVATESTCCCSRTEETSFVSPATFCDLLWFACCYHFRGHGRAKDFARERIEQNDSYSGKVYINIAYVFVDLRKP